MVDSTAARWSSLLDEAEGSGLSLRAFARSRRVNGRTLAWWKWRLGWAPSAKPQTEPATRFLEVVVASPAPVGVVIELGRARIAVDQATDLALVRRVVDALS